MSSKINKMLEKLLNLGLADEYSNDLNQKQVVNFSYLLFCCANVFLVLIFLMRHTPSIALFGFVALWFGVAGLRFNYRGSFFCAQILLPIVAMFQLSVLSLFYFGSDSAIHWFLINLISYAFTVFRSDQKYWKYGVTLSAIMLFLVCEFLGPNKGLYLSAQDQDIALVLVFLCSSLAVAIMVNLVINRLRAVNEHLRKLAEVDELTGLSNRRKVLADAVNIFADSVIHHDSCVFAIIDLDHFKKINDTFGHEAGDLVLVKVADVMAKVIRAQDEIGRYGGEEFIVIMRKINLKQAEVVMERVREAVESMLIETEQGIIIPVTISVGLSAIESNVSRYEEILAQADKALYVAKRNGRNRVAVDSSYKS